MVFLWKTFGGEQCGHGGLSYREITLRNICVHEVETQVAAGSQDRKILVIQLKGGSG